MTPASPAATSGGLQGPVWGKDEGQVPWIQVS